MQTLAVAWCGGMFPTDWPNTWGDQLPDIPSSPELQTHRFTA